VISGLLLVAIGLGVGWDLTTSARRRRSLAALVSDLEAGTARSLTEALRRSLHDDTVEVEYWIPRLDRYVDPQGRSAEEEQSPNRSVVTIERSGEELGRVLHTSTVPVRELERQIGAAARLAVDNERLRAELKSQALEMKASQERIVLAADTTRRQIERDLHDGAQQRLLTLSYQLRLARAEAESADDEGSAARLAEAAGVLTSTIDEVRAIAHGIFPSILADAGLARALESLREDVGVSLDIHVGNSEITPAVEMAAYHLVTAVVGSLPEDDRIAVAIDLAQLDGHLDLDVEIRGWSLPEVPTNASDRIGALGGSIRPTPGGIHAEIPCR
jgi:signal transduction histidine kinase